MSDFPAVLYVDLIKSPIRRKQPWRWVAKSAYNQRKLATSGEWYSNLQDALDAIALVFGDGTSVFLRQSEKGNIALRRPV